MLINIDNGGTFTDICVIKNKSIFRAKTPTTPFDLSECFFEGLRKVSIEVFGSEDVAGLLAETKKIRYSTTQGTNALVQRKGPRIGLILQEGTFVNIFNNSKEMFEALVDKRIAFVDTDKNTESLEEQLVNAVNELTLAGANRLVLSFEESTKEKIAERIIRKRFPEHLLGTVPVVVASGLSQDSDLVRRTWTALFNAFLHPSMEKFLYYAENRLRAQKFVSPLLIYRNDGDSGRVAKTTAIKTYSSGPRGGMDGAVALAAHYGFEELLTMDVGGTTTDIGLVTNNSIRNLNFGQIEGAELSFPLSDLVSVGVGGGSIIRAEQNNILVGPESVGSAPGPACFGLGGSQATITDFALAAGIIDSATYFGGSMALDLSRSEAAITAHIAEPLQLSLDDALNAMQQAWVKDVAKALKKFTKISDKTVLGGFGGAGPLAVCSVADAAGISKIIIPQLAAVFCALGIGFSEVGHSYEKRVDLKTPKNNKSNSKAPDSESDPLQELIDALKTRALLDMLAEGFSENQCQFQWTLLSYQENNQSTFSFLNIKEIDRSLITQDAVIRLRVSAALEQPSFGEKTQLQKSSAVSEATRNILIAGQGRKDVPLYRVDQQAAGVQGKGPAILEDPYFTLPILPNWQFEFTAGKDIILTKQ